MLARMPKLYSADETQSEREARRVVRKPAQVDVTATSAEGLETPVVIRDISSHGCSIPPAAEWLRLGAFVWLRAGSEAAVIGIVRWIRGDSAGIEFLRPLAPGNYGLASLIDDDI